MKFYQEIFNLICQENKIESGIFIDRKFSILGKGNYNSNKAYIKMYIDKIDNIEFKKIKDEYDIHLNLSHNNIAPILYSSIKKYNFTNNNINYICYYFIYQDLDNFINLDQYFKKYKTTLYFNEAIINIIRKMHKLNITHGDLNFENIMIRNINNNIDIKLIDFNSSIDWTEIDAKYNFNKTKYNDLQYFLY